MVLNGSDNIKIKALEKRVKELTDELNLADELHFDECAKYQKEISELKRELRNNELN